MWPVPTPDGFHLWGYKAAMAANLPIKSNNFNMRNCMQKETYSSNSSHIILVLSQRSLEICAWKCYYSMSVWVFSRWVQSPKPCTFKLIADLPLDVSVRACNGLATCPGCVPSLYPTLLCWDQLQKTPETPLRYQIEGWSYRPDRKIMLVVWQNVTECSLSVVCRPATLLDEL